MHLSRNARFAVVLLATVNWVLPASQLYALQAPEGRLTLTVPQSRPVHVNDIELGAGGVLNGYVLNRQGQPLDAYSLKIAQAGRPAVEVVTNQRGKFSASAMRGGMFQVVAGKQTYLCRGWATGTAPPKARNQLLVVPEGVTERGQRPMGDLFFANPVMVGLILGAAVAIPIAVSNSKDDPPAGS